MQYRRDKKGNELSVLGYGCMRFTKNGSSVDLDKAEKEVMAAIKAGVNYFDTAYVYAGNEAAVGEILDRNHCREQIYLATKLPHYLIKSVAGAEKMFQEELRRLKTDYIDYYLMHMLTDIPTWEKLKKIGPYVEAPDDDMLICRCEEVTKGEIRRAVHAGLFTIEEIRRFLRSGMGLCQGQTCGKLVKGIVARELGVSPLEIEPATSRAPMRPTEMKILAKDGGAYHG